MSRTVFLLSSLTPCFCTSLNTAISPFSFSSHPLSCSPRHIPPPSHTHTHFTLTSLPFPHCSCLYGSRRSLNHPSEISNPETTVQSPFCNGKALPVTPGMSCLSFGDTFKRGAERVSQLAPTLVGWFLCVRAVLWWCSLGTGMKTASCRPSLPPLYQFCLTVWWVFWFSFVLLF